MSSPQGISTRYWLPTPVNVDTRTRPRRELCPARGAPTSAIEIFSGRTPTFTGAPTRASGRRDVGTATVPPSVRPTLAVAPFTALTTPPSRFDAPRKVATNSVDGLS